MVKEKDEKFVEALKKLAPGTQLREGLENVLRAKTGALIVVSDSPEVLALAEGGFEINGEYSPAKLYELAKMDGAIILNSDGTKILKANTQLMPDSSIPSFETGIRHRSAERVARQTGEMVISISQRRNVITMYLGAIKYALRDIPTILTKANQGLNTLEKYKVIIDKAFTSLTSLEFEDLVTVFDVVKLIQRIEMFARMVQEMEQYIIELGNEGRLVSMQLEELVANVDEQCNLIIQDYHVYPGDKPIEEIREEIRNYAGDLPDTVSIAKALGFGASLGVLDLSVAPRGYRILDKVPRLPVQVVDNLVETFGGLHNIMRASIEELDDVEGIGEVRARAIKEGLRRMREQALLDREL